MKSLLFLCVLLLVGCKRADVAEASSQEGVTFFGGCCDASAGAPLSDDLFVMADDEDNVLRIFSRTMGGGPVQKIDLKEFLRAPKTQEADIEGAAVVGKRIYWITSHGNNTKGNERETRHRFFATDLVETSEGVRLQPAGTPYMRLLQDLMQAPSLTRFNLPAAATRAPKAPGALNIEGLAATADGQLLIGFRNPIPDNKALLVPLLNPAEVIGGSKASLGEPILLDLGGYGVRSMEQTKDGYYISAGGYDETKKPRIYFWNGNTSAAPHSLEAQFSRGFNPEGLFMSSGLAGRDELVVLSDDGTMKIGGVDCKALKVPEMKHFRAMTVIPNKTEITAQSREGGRP